MANMKMIEVGLVVAGLTAMVEIAETAKIAKITKRSMRIKKCPTK